MTPILYTRSDSNYKQFNTDCWDETRNALKWPGGEPLIAHPPCRLWGRLRQFSTAPTEEKNLAIDAIKQVQKWGGVLEHPAYSTLWKEMKLPYPNEKPDHHGGWTLLINQAWFGHRAQKKTFLYIKGCKPNQIPPYPISLDTPTMVIKNMSKKEREHTPIELCKWLISLTNKIKTICQDGNNSECKQQDKE